jgi:serine/threonine-protein kinase
MERLRAALADRYRIERELGAGGMATVYLAADLKHDRKVAVKVLKPELAAVLGAERFVQEIKTTAALQHPHILPLFDSGQADGFLFYVMPYIQGETLRSKLDRERQLGVEEAVRITTDVADALDYAHRHGVIHRDIKPENILLHDGRPMVADFGIALALSAAAGGRMTETGLSLGTPHYMSPEQATAEKEITARSDVYSLASVLYEMLAGQPPHLGGSAQQIIMKIIAEPVAAVTSLRKSVPANVAAALAKALEKLPADRFATAAEFGAALANSGFGGTVTTTAAASRPSVPPYRRSRGMLALVATTAAAVALAVWGWLRPTPVPPVLRYGLALPPSQAPDPRYPAPQPAPDGSFLVYHGPVEGSPSAAQLWLKRRDRYDATPISGSLGAQSFTFSPDGKWLAFATGGQLKTLPIGGGGAVTIVSEGVAGARGVAWLDDGTIVYPAPAGMSLRQVSAGGGASAEVWKSDSLVAMAPTPIVGGRGALFSACAARCGLWALDLRNGSAHPVMPGADVGRYITTGHLVYGQGRALFAVPFDVDRLAVRGSPVSLLDSVSVSSPAIGPALGISLSGTLVTRAASNATVGGFEMVWVDRSGRATPVDTSWTFLATSYAGNHGWALSPDGSRLAIGLNTESGDDIWVKRLPRGPLSRISYDQAPDFRPRWNGDGRFITFASNRETRGLYQRRADGTGADSLLVAGLLDEGMWSPDGTWLVLRQGGTTALSGGRDITGVRPGTDSAPVPVLVTPFDEEAIALSPDGRWLAYQSDETGRTEVFLRPFPNTDGGKWQVSNGGGTAPLWARNGRELFYVSGENDMMAVPVTAGPAPRLGEPHLLFRVPDELLAVESNYYTPWDVGTDGRFIMARLLRTSAVGAEAPVIVVENWFEELRAKMGQ